MTTLQIGERRASHDAPRLANTKRTIEIGFRHGPVTTGNDPVPLPPHVPARERLAADVTLRRPRVEPGTGEIELLAGLIAVVTSLSARLDRLEALHEAATVESSL